MLSRRLVLHRTHDLHDPDEGVGQRLGRLRLYWRGRWHRRSPPRVVDDRYLYEPRNYATDVCMPQTSECSLRKAGCSAPVGHAGRSVRDDEVLEHLTGDRVVAGHREDE